MQGGLTPNIRYVPPPVGERKRQDLSRLRAYLSMSCCSFSSRATASAASGAGLGCGAALNLAPAPCRSLTDCVDGDA